MTEPRCATWLAVLALALFIAIVLSAGARKSETIDEGLFVGGGVAQVVHLDPNIDLTHPPLLRWVSGLPAVVVGGARLPEPVPFVPRGALDLLSYKVQDVFEWGAALLNDTRHSHDRVLFWGRFPFALIGAVLGWLVFLETRKLFGPWPALGALLAFAFTPEVLAHAEWAHSDLTSALSVWLVGLGLARALSRPSWRSATLLGASMGLAVAVKLTALVLWPLVLILVLAFSWKERLRFLGHAAIALTVFYAILVAAYLPEPRLGGPHEIRREELARLRIAPLEPVLRIAPLPDTFLKGVVYTALLGGRGQIAFLHGEKSVTGWWYYFPVAIFLKYPTGLLTLSLIGLAMLWRGPWPWSSRIAMTVPPIVILVAAMMQSINVGVRSVLPLAPFLALWSGAALQRWRGAIGRGATGLLLATSVLSGLLAYPDFLTYFNPLLGGTAAADRWLVDSNLDWGQDLPELARELRRRGVREIRLAYFGPAVPERYGIRALSPSVVAPGWYAISRSYLSGWWPPGDPYRWLRELEPLALVGGSIALYQVSEAQAAAARPRGAESAPEAAMMQQGLDALYSRGDPEAAATEFRRVLERNPTHYGATFQLATALDRAGKPLEARPLWEKVFRMAEGYGDKATADTARERLEKRP